MAEARLKFGACCACGGTTNVRNGLMLEQKCPTPSRGWGCVVCHLPSDGAVALVCDACLHENRPLKFACTGYPAVDGRTPIEQLTGTHQHDMRFHPDE
jgi:hypothetical protein